MSEININKEINAAGNYPARRHSARERKLLETAKSVRDCITVVWDFAEHGGATGDIGLGVSVPEDAIVTLSGYDVITAPTSATDTGTIKFKLGSQASADVVAAITADGAATLGPTAGSVTGYANAIKATADREITATIATEAITAGKIRLFLDIAKSE